MDNEGTGKESFKEKVVNEISVKSNISDIINIIKKERDI